MQLAYTFHPRKIALILGILALYLGAQSLIVEYLIENVLDSDAHRSLILVLDLFSVNVEESIPTWYATLLLFGAAVLLAVIAAAKAIANDGYARHWTGLALIFLYLSMDEGAAIHEIVADAIQTSLEPTGYLLFGWQLVAVPLVILFAVLYRRFLFHLSPRTRNLFILAGVIYVGGALVVEAISANRWYLDGGQTFEYLAIATVEEVAEMLGAVVLIYTLLAYIVQMQYVVAFYPAAPSPQPEVTSPSSGTALIQWRRPVQLILLVILAANIVLVSWAMTQAPAPIQRDPAAINQAIIDQLAAYDVQVTPLPGHFGVDNLSARQAAAALLAEFDAVMIVTWASTEASIALAADELPFDRNHLTQVLYENGETQFVIFDTLAVRALVGDIQPLPPDPSS